MIDDPLDIRAIDLRVAFYLTIVTSLGGGSGALFADPVSSVQDFPSRELDLRLWPNPFNPRTEVFCELDRAGWVELGVYDLSGRQVVVLHQGTVPAGPFTSTWDGLDSHGLAQPGGVYLFRLATSAGPQGIKGVLLK